MNNCADYNKACICLFSSLAKESKLADLTSAIICSGENLLVVCGARTGSLYTLDTRQSQSSMLAAPSTDQVLMCPMLILS